MKYLIVSDIHGSIESANIIIENFNKYNCDYIICLGDVLYHGPRNDLPLFYEPKKVISLLNEYAQKIICIKGNCDAEVDEMVLKFKLHKEIDLEINNIMFHLEHGHHLDELNTSCKYILYGHTHVSKIEESKDKIYINPGSITLPKENTKKSFIILEDNVISLYDINNNLIMKKNLPLI